MTHAHLLILLLTALCVAGCYDRDERLRAVEEVEAHCGFARGSLNRSHVHKKFAVNDEMSKASQDRAKRTIDLGEVMPHALAVAKRDCITNYNSRAGYHFSLGIVSPTTLPNDKMTSALLAAQIPADVRRLVASEKPKPGAAYLLRSDRLILHPESRICELRSMISPSIADLGASGLGIDGGILSKRIKELGAKDYLDGSPRQRPRESTGCSNSDFNIYYIGSVQENRDGEPYHLTLAVWQGDRAWVGGIERAPTQLHANADALLGGIEKPQNEPSLEAKIIASVRADAQDLSARMVQHLIIGEVRDDQS